MPTIPQLVGEIHERTERNGQALNFAAWAQALMLAKGNKQDAADIFAYHFPHSRAIETVRKAAISAASTSDTAWGGALSPMDTFGAAFIEYLRPRTVIGRMSGFRTMPMNVSAPRVTASTSVSWVGQSRAMPATAMAFDVVRFKPAKIGGLVVITEELAKSSDPDATRLIREDLSNAVVDFSDQAFLGSAAEVTDVSPAGLANGASTVASTGTTADAFATDFRALCALVTTHMTHPYLVMKPSTAIALAAMDAQLTRNVGATGGDIAGIPVITTTNVPADGDSPGDNQIILIDAGEILLNEGAVELDASKNALVEMNSTPDSPATAATTMVSLWQANLLGILVRRYIRWEKRRDGCVAVLTGLGY